MGTRISGASYVTLIEHYDGSSWTVQSSPNGTGDESVLYGVASTGSSNSIAVGYTGTSNPTSTQTLAMGCAC